MTLLLLHILTPAERAQNDEDRRFASAVRHFGNVARFRHHQIPSALKSKSKKIHVESATFNDSDSSVQLPTVPEALAPGVGCSIPPSFDPSSMQGCRSVERDMSDYCKQAVQQYKDLAGGD